MLRIDAHQHFWQYEPVRDGWITEEMGVIRKDFMPADLQPVLEQARIDGSVAVQADQSETESNFLLSLAEKYDFIRAVVGWVDLQADNLRERLDYYHGYNKLKGFRHVLQSEKDDAFMLRESFKRGIALLQLYGYTYDILIYPIHLENAEKLVASFPNQPFVIDHLAKPYIKDRQIERWKKDIALIARHDNVYCKVSGMVTEADWLTWKKPDLAPYLDAIFESFGSHRIMFGSDWPVCLIAATYEEVAAIVDDYTRDLSINEQAAIWGGNATLFYHLT